MNCVLFDRLKLSVPRESLTILNDSVFTNTIFAGELKRSRYEQTSPFFYSICIDYHKNEADIEFSGKALLDDYPFLINFTNITTCIQNINSYGVCNINPEQVIQTAYVKQCDVTYDVSSPYSIQELYTSINLSSSKKWCVRDICSNRFTIENTNITKKCKGRMIIYDKGEEIRRNHNADFLRAISNPEEQLEFFRDKTRMELNLNSVDRIRRYFKTSDTKLTTLLYSEIDPIARFLSDALSDDDTFQRASHLSGNIRELERLLFLAACNYDATKVELAIRNLYGRTVSVTRSRKPYDKLLQHLREAIPNPCKNPECKDITSHLKYMLGLLNNSDGKVVPSLLSLYSYARPVFSSVPESTNDSLFNVNPPIPSFD